MIDDNVITGVISLGVDYYKGEDGRDGRDGRDGYTPRKGIDYFTQADIDEIIAQIPGGGGGDLSQYAKLTDLPTKVSQLTNDRGYIASESDPTVPNWAKSESKPTYTAQEVGALPDSTVLFSGNYNDLTNKPTIPVVPTNVSAFTNDAGYLTQHQDISGKQNTLTAGSGITISNDTISASSQLPANPANNGTYILKRVVSSGSATDSWESVTVGGSY